MSKNLYDAFPDQNGLKQGNALSSLLFNFAPEYAITSLRWTTLTSTEMPHKVFTLSHM